MTRCHRLLPGCPNAAKRLPEAGAARRARVHSRHTGRPVRGKPTVIEQDPIAHFESVRKRFYDEFAAIQRQADECAQRLRDGSFTLKDAATFAGLHDQKKSLFARFIAQEEAALEAILQRLTGKNH
jgi:hypothetical protein